MTLDFNKFKCSSKPLNVLKYGTTLDINQCNVESSQMNFHAVDPAPGFKKGKILA